MTQDNIHINFTLEDSSQDSFRRVGFHETTKDIFTTSPSTSPQSSSLSPIPFPNLCLPSVGIPRTQSTGALRMLKKNVLFEAGRNSEEVMVTPFSQIVHTLKSVKSNFVLITKMKEERRRGGMGWSSNDHTVEELESLSSSTLEELDWCLEQLQMIQTHRSISEMATNKFKKLLNKELVTFAGSSKAGNQISEYITSTFLDSPKQFLDKHDDVFVGKMPSKHKKLNTELFEPIHDDNKLKGETFEDQRSDELFFEAITVTMDSSLDTANDSSNTMTQRKSPMSEITGLKRPSISPSLPFLPKYGVQATDEEKLQQRMSEIDRWGVDLFEIGDLTQNRPLTAITYHLLVKRDLLRTFGIVETTLLNYLLTLEDHYRPQTPYHNSYHAADVTQSAHVLLNMSAFENLFTDLEILSTLIACAMHDVDHPGLTNNYFINIESDLALMYNDESVLESHHLAVGFKLLQQPDCNFLANLPKKSRQFFRRTVISIVLATDMNKHVEHVAHLKAMVEARRLNKTDVMGRESPAERVVILQHLVHCADLSNPTKHLPLYRRWLDLIMEEFFKQGDLERSQSLDISPMCDRTTATVEKYQVGFIDYIVHPLWDTWGELVQPGCQEILQTLEKNRDWFFKAIPESTSPFERNDSKKDKKENEENLNLKNKEKKFEKFENIRENRIEKKGSLEGDFTAKCSFVLREDAGSEKSPTRPISFLLTSTSADETFKPS